MEASTETDFDLSQSEPWTMLEDSDIEVCDEPSKTVQTPNEDGAKLTEITEDQSEEEDDFAKLRKHRQYIKELEATEDLAWDHSDITQETTTAAEDSATTPTAVCARCSICSVLLTKGSSRLASYLCNTFLALCVLAVASCLAYYFQFPDQLTKSNIKDIIVRYSQPNYAMRYDKYIDPKSEKKKHFYYDHVNKHPDYKKYEDTTRKQQRKKKNDKRYQNYEQNDYKNRKEYKGKKRYNKYDLDESRYNKKDFDKKAYKVEYKDYKQKKNTKSKGDYKRK